MMDVINPWGALRRLRKELEVGHAAHLEEQKKWTALNRKLEALIAQGHFRNPKTGCIGPKGKTFK
jgi:hypothetical protein